MMHQIEYLLQTKNPPNWMDFCLAQREGFVLDFCSTFRILYSVMFRKNLRSPFQNNTLCCFVRCVRIQFATPVKQKIHPTGWISVWRRGRDSNPRELSPKLISSSCKAGSFCPSLSLISAKISELVTALLPLPRKMHGFLKAEGTSGHYFVFKLAVFVENSISYFYKNFNRAPILSGLIKSL